MVSQVDICNMALGDLHTDPIQALDQKKSKPARVCNTYYDLTRTTLLRSHVWSFASRLVALAPVTNDSGRWAFKYKYPGDSLKLARLDDTAGSFANTTVPYEILSDASGRFIYTNLEQAVAKYVVDSNDPNKYDPDFTQAFVKLLAAAMYSAIKSTSKGIEEARGQAVLALRAARAADGDETVAIFNPEPDWITLVYGRGADPISIWG